MESERPTPLAPPHPNGTASLRGGFGLNAVCDPCRWVDFTRGFAAWLATNDTAFAGPVARGEMVLLVNGQVCHRLCHPLYHQLCHPFGGAARQRPGVSSRVSSSPLLVTGQASLCTEHGERGIALGVGPRLRCMCPLGNGQGDSFPLEYVRRNLPGSFLKFGQAGHEFGSNYERYRAAARGRLVPSPSITLPFRPSCFGSCCETPTFLAHRTQTQNGFGPDPASLRRTIPPIGPCTFFQAHAPYVYGLQRGRPVRSRAELSAETCWTMGPFRNASACPVPWNVYAMVQWLASVHLDFWNLQVCAAQMMCKRLSHHSKRSAARTSRAVDLSFGHVMQPRPPADRVERTVPNS